jgi:hypothetical protein
VATEKVAIERAAADARTLARAEITEESNIFRR